MVNNVNIRVDECAWAHFEMKILGRTIRGLRGYEIKHMQEKEYLHGSGTQPLDIQEGNETYPGNIKVLGFEKDAMNRAAQKAGYPDIVKVPHEAIVITGAFQKSKLDKKTYITIRGVSFEEVGDSMEQNAKFRECTLPFKAMSYDSVTL